jgi:thiol-disulfide isomerase/thioredoxin
LRARKAGHEYSPLTEQTVNYKNWSLPNLKTDKPEDLRKLIAGKKLVMVVYFAPWCGNWRNEAPIAAKLYEKYKAQGFQVIGVSEYASRDDVKNYFGKDGPPYPIVTESESREDKQKTRTMVTGSSPAINATGARRGTFFSNRQSSAPAATC